MPGEERQKYSFHSFGCHFVEVMVDEPIGRCRVTRVCSAIDNGRVINHKTAQPGDRRRHHGPGGHPGWSPTPRAAESVDVRVGFVDQMRIATLGTSAFTQMRELLIVGRSRPSPNSVHFHQGHVKAHGDAADHLAARGFVVDDAAVVDGAAESPASAAPSTTAASSTTKPRAAR